jgi:isopentenyldiphosphate isomerase
MTTQDEWVDVIDEADRVIGRATRRQMRTQNLLHRGVGVLCFDPQGRIYVHRRTQHKDVFPGMYDMFAGGVVAAGESYDAAARREIEEELGIVGPIPQRLFMHRFESAQTRSWNAVYRVTWGGAIRHQASEVEWGRFCTLDEIVRNAANWRFVPDGWEIFQRFIKL